MGLWDTLKSLGAAPREPEETGEPLDPRLRGNAFPSIAGLRPDDRGKPSLGNPEVVNSVISDMVQEVLDDPAKTEDAIREATDILVGRSEHYAAMGPWNYEGLGDWIRGSMQGVPADGGARSAVEYALAHLALHAVEMARAAGSGDLTEEAAGKRLGSLVKNWTNLMVGASSAASA